MTGWRIGYAAGAKDVISAMSKLQGQSTSNPTSIAQMAAVEALNGPQKVIEDRTREFQRRKNYVVTRLNNIEGFQCFDPLGAFYVFPSIEGFIGRRYKERIINNSIDFTEFLLIPRPPRSTRKVSSAASVCIRDSCGALSRQNYRSVVDSVLLQASEDIIHNGLKTRCRLYHGRSAMSSSEGFDRPRILEWLQGISSPAVHSQSPEVRSLSSV